MPNYPLERAMDGAVRPPEARLRQIPHGSMDDHSGPMVLQDSESHPVFAGNDLVGPTQYYPNLPEGQDGLTIEGLHFPIPGFGNPPSSSLRFRISLRVRPRSCGHNRKGSEPGDRARSCGLTFGWHVGIAGTAASNRVIAKRSGLQGST